MPSLPSLPIVDISGFADGKGPADKEIAAQLVAAFRDRGFAYVQGFEVDVSPNTVNTMYDQMIKFFNLPMEDKMRIVRPKNGRDTLGYAYPGMSVVTQGVTDPAALEKAKKAAAKADENYMFRNDLGPVTLNRYPSDKELPNFVRDGQEFMGECHVLYSRILRILALGLGFDVHFFEPYHVKGGRDVVALKHYLECPATEVGRLNAHTDYGYITILFQDNVGGLEVVDCGNNGAFIPAPPLPGAVIVNVGDNLSRWTNGILRSTMHRVRAPPGLVKDGIQPERYSFPYFGGPDDTTIVDPIPGTYGPDRPKLFEPINGWEHIVTRQARQYNPTVVD